VDHREKAVGLIGREKSEPSSGRQSFAKGNGAHPSDFETGRQLGSMPDFSIYAFERTESRERPQQL